MSQTVTVQVKLLPNQNQSDLLSRSSTTYIATINALVAEMIQAKEPTRKTSKHVNAPLPSAVKNQAIRDAKSVFRKAKKSQYRIIPILKKPCILWNNQNYTFDDESVSVPLMVDGKSKRIRINATFTQDILTKLASYKHGTLRITKKAHKWIAQFSIEIATPQNTGTKTMGVDLGLKVPAVAVTEDEKTRFFGNGRRNKYVRRMFKSKRQQLGRKKKLTAIKKLNNKEQRWMKDQDHKVSRQIVDFAIKQQVSIILLEQLANIRQTAKTSRKNAKNLHTWTFYRLTTFIEYKAALMGIKIEYVDPKYTSQTCPSCGNRNKSKDRSYKCRCGYHTHRDRVGAMNIRHAPVIDGQSRPA
ncbi:RNA-guided endonuclease InsQ/TnpB family protein [Pseudalkalibacillus sp. R45]|uniref:RNA-guided endonuclease InsQ/TnpB family protein n=1 Tax=Pseudalkalibacillus sp. R45 TaxID=3457433 RepID=UPI003FCD2553